MSDDYASLFEASPDVPAVPLFPDAVGAVLHAMLNAEPEPGPPYMHTVKPPEPAGYDEDGRPIWDVPVSFTIEESGDG